LSGLLTLGIGIANAADTAQRQPNVLHEMVPHVVLPETIQYNKTAKNLPGAAITGVNAPYVATYVAYPSYQVPSTAAFQAVEQSVYPVSPKMLPAPLPREEDDLAGAEFVLKGKDANSTDKIGEPIRLASASDEIAPTLPKPTGEVLQTGVFCQHPAGPPSAWAFSSPIFKVASVPAGWGGGQMGSINQNGVRGCSQQVGFQPVGMDPAAVGSAMPQGVPYSTFQMGQQQAPEQGTGTQAQLLPNGMVLLTMPPDHSNCGLIRCKTGNTPRTILLPPAGYGLPQTPQQSMMMPGGFGMPVMSVAQQPQMMPQMMPQMQAAPMMVMTPTGPVIMGYAQMPTPAMPNPMVASQVPGAPAENGEGAAQTPPSASTSATGLAATLVATPFGYTLQVPADATQADVQMQIAQMQQALLQSQMAAPNPYASPYATPFGSVAMNPMGQFGGYGMPVMNAGYQPPGMLGGGQGMTVSDMIQIMTFLNNNKQQRRARLMDRIAERRESRQAAGGDPFTQLMQAWSTPYISPDTTLRMPSRNAYPYGYFGVQALPADTANYGGYHNLYVGSTAYPGLY